MPEDASAVLSVSAVAAAATDAALSLGTYTVTLVSTAPQALLFLTLVCSV
jgi:hypothetical protein